MLIAVAFLLVAFEVRAQELGTALSTLHSTQAPHLPFLDLFPGASSYNSDSIRKSYGEPSHGHTICPSYKSDSLSSFASILGSAAKIMLSAVAITFLKMIAGKLLLFPLTVLLMVKMGIKTLLLWPMMSKLFKYLRKKKKKHNQGRSIGDCSGRIVCIMKRTLNASWVTNLGTAATFLLLPNIDNDSSYGMLLLNILAGEKVAKCMKIACSEGVDFS